MAWPQGLCSYRLPSPSPPASYKDALFVTVSLFRSTAIADHGCLDPDNIRQRPKARNGPSPSQPRATIIYGLWPWFTYVYGGCWVTPGGLWSNYGVPKMPEGSTVTKARWPWSCSFLAFASLPFPSLPCLAFSRPEATHANTPRFVKSILEKNCVVPPT